MAKLMKHSKGAVPTLDDASDNLGVVSSPTPSLVEDSERIKPMSFKVPESFFKEYKQFALDNDISLTELLKRSFQHFKVSK